MKLRRALALLLIPVLVMSGCSSAGTQGKAAFYEEDLPEMGNIYLTTNGSDPWEYQNAVLSADWEGGAVPERTVQIKLRGNSSTQADKKSYNVKFSEKVSFMNMGEGKKWSLLANPYDKSLLRVSLAFGYAEALGLPYVSETRLCKLWLNDAYMGIYVAVEPIGDGKDRIDIATQSGDAIFEHDVNRLEEGKTYFQLSNGVRMQINEPETPTTEQVNAYKVFLEAVFDALETGDHTIYEQLIDVDSFVNFYIFEEVVKDIDFCAFSTRWFLRDGKLYAGPPWDLDLSMGNVSQVYWEENYKLYHNKPGYGTESRDSTEGLWAQRDFYYWLCRDDYFMELVRARWQEMLPVTRNLVEDNDLGTSLIDRYMEAYGEALETNFDMSEDGAGWCAWIQYGEYADQSAGWTLEENVDELRQWLMDRITWLDGQFGASGD